MLNKILFLTKECAKTKYTVCSNVTEAKQEDTLVITDNQSEARNYLSMDFAVLYVSSEDEFATGIPYVCTGLSDCDDDYFEMVFARIKKQPLKILETERTIVREMTVSDLPLMYELYDDSDITRFVEPLYDYEEEKLFTEKYIENMYGFYGYGLWLVFHKESGELIGRMGISIRNIDGNDENELGYVVHRKYRGQGYAKEVCQAIISYAKEALDIEKLYIVTRSQNTRSVGLAGSLGFDYLTDVIQDEIEYKFFVKST